MNVIHLRMWLIQVQYTNNLMYTDFIMASELWFLNNNLLNSKNECLAIVDHWCLQDAYTLSHEIIFWVQKLHSYYQTQWLLSDSYSHIKQMLPAQLLEINCRSPCMWNHRAIDHSSVADSMHAGLRTRDKKTRLMSKLFRSPSIKARKQLSIHEYHQHFGSIHRAQASIRPLNE